jgi:hypothetical protein
MAVLPKILTVRAAIDPRDALRLPKRARLVVSWYSREAGLRHAAGKVLCTTASAVKLIVWPFHSKPKRIRLQNHAGTLRYGSTYYELRYPNAHEVATIGRVEEQYYAKKLGWRFTAKKRYRILSDWRYWASKRVQELS